MASEASPTRECMPLLFLLYEGATHPRECISLVPVSSVLSEGKYEFVDARAIGTKRCSPLVRISLPGVHCWPKAQYHILPARPQETSHYGLEGQTYKEIEIIK